MHYVNIATPATWDDGTLRFVDLDLDVIWRADSGEVILDDEDEFALHQVRFGYPSDLIEQARRSGEEVRELIARSASTRSTAAYSPGGLMVLHNERLSIRTWTLPRRRAAR